MTTEYKTEDNQRERIITEKYKTVNSITNPTQNEHQTYESAKRTIPIYHRRQKQQPSFHGKVIVIMKRKQR